MLLSNAECKTMNILSNTHKKILSVICKSTKATPERVLLEALMDYHKSVTGKEFRL